jgi:hypothetical protein
MIGVIRIRDKERNKEKGKMKREKDKKMSNKATTSLDPKSGESWFTLFP